MTGNKAHQTLFTLKALHSFIEHQRSEKKDADKVLKSAERDAEEELFVAIDGGSALNPSETLKELRVLRGALSDATTNREASATAFKADIDGASKAMNSILAPSVDGRQMSIDMNMVEGDGVEIFPEDVEFIRGAIEFHTERYVNCDSELYTDGDAEIAGVVLGWIGKIEKASIQAANDG